MIESIFSGAAAVTGVASAICWIKAARAEIPAQEGDGVGALFGGGLTVRNVKGQIIDLHGTYRAQSRWNGYAAYLAAAAALSVAVSSVAGILKI